MPERECVICGEMFTTKSSRRKICYKQHYHPCPICGKNVKTDMHHKNNCCCKEHSRMLAMKTIHDRYEESPCNSVEAKARRERTCVERYGVKNIFQSEVIKSKIRNTLLSKYGVDNISKSKDIIEKRKQTNIERYGGTAPACNDTVLQKMYDTIRNRYGVNAKSTLVIPEVVWKCKETTMKKYGVENYMQNPICNFKHNLNRKFLGAYKISMKKCKLCGKEFTPWTIRQTYCNAEHTSKCVVCGKEFMVKNNYHIPNTCSTKCSRDLAVYGVFMSD